ncbi:MAG: PQQ-binding-like beta-propeller repeat protein [Streptomycetaceae bacterium]|nr:PQQ-binding-like beta-propeller repeat protein [Streptomycetaceae bacterium]
MINMEGHSMVEYDTLSDVLALGDTLAYLYDGDGRGLTAYRLSTGDVAWHAPMPDSNTGGQGQGTWAPRLAGTAVVGTFGTSTAGVGTSAGRHAITVVAYDATTGRQRWSTQFAQGDGTDQTLGAPRVVAADDAHVLVSVAQEGYSSTPPMSALLDARTGAVIWTDPDFNGIALAKTVAAGTTQDENEFVGKAVSDGHQVWNRTVGIGDLITKPLGPALIWVNAISGDPTNMLLDPATGKTRLSLDHSVQQCQYDGWATVVCSGDSVVAVDVSTGRVLWRLPDQATNRIAPQKVGSVWHGVIYAETSNPMTLDAQTGKDIRTDIGTDPSMVNDHYGLVYDDQAAPSVEVYRAIS